MSDVFSSYEQGLKILLERLGKDHPRYAEALVLQARLLENIAHARRYGDTETLRAERAQIVEALNSLAVQAVDVSFLQIASGGGVDSYAPTRVLSSQAREVSEHLRSVKKYLRKVRGFPPKQVVDELFLVIEQTAQFIEQTAQFEETYDDIALRLRIREMLTKVDERLRHCRTQARILRQWNGKWYGSVETLETDPVEKLLASIDEIVDSLDQIASL